jgi:hypothetical protein
MMKHRKLYTLLAVVTSLSSLLLLAACGREIQRNNTTETQVERIEATKTDKDTVFRPPTTAPETALAIPSPTAMVNATSTFAPTLRPSATAPCSDDLLFVEDSTIPDGSSIKVNDAIDKRWLVENNGSCNWGPDYRLRLIEGPSLGAATEQALFPALSGTQALIRILFQAPAAAGAYRSAWQAHRPSGEAFGDIIYIDIQVID